MFLIKRENVNNIKDKPLVALKPKKLRLILINEETGEIEYSNTTEGGIFCSLEKIKTMTPELLEANHQVVGWGHPFSQFYGMERINETMQDNKQLFIDVLNGKIT